MRNYSTFKGGINEILFGKIVGRVARVIIIKATAIATVVINFG